MLKSFIEYWGGETCKYTKRIPNMHFCILNDTIYSIEDEFHALFECKLYGDIRQRY